MRAVALHEKTLKNMENANGMLNMSEEEMIDLWKTLLHLEPTRHDCTLEREDGIDLDSLLTTHIRGWYAHLLATAPAELLPIDDVKADVNLSADTDGVVTATVPELCVRPVEWRLKNWHRSVTRFMTPGEPEALRQQNPWTRGKSHNPAIVDCGNRLMLFSALPNMEPELTLARCVVRPKDGSYRLHRLLLRNLPALA